ncbi:MAG TPA: efflux RND transporter periplasmic adaptor subunit [Deltaproteobacteria bacterium]|nr:efflux RND transporter periplasmic adaptor subunit [Deltaproteobacteria bacterium]
MAGHMKPREGSPAWSGLRAGTGIILLAAAVLLLSACGKKEEGLKTEKISNVKVWTVEKRSVRPYIETIGNLGANEQVTVSSEVDGILREVLVDEGTPVTRGMVLARVDETDYRLAVDTAEAALRQAEAALKNVTVEFGRKEALLKEELVTQQQFDDVSTRKTVATHDLNRARAALSLAQERLRKTVVTSPMVGVVKEKKASAGDFVRTSSPLMAIVQVDPLKLTFTIPEKDVASLKTGQEVTFTVDPFPGRQFSGRVSAINPSLDERTRSLQAEAVVGNAAFELKPGFFARVKIYTGSLKEAVVVPATSILYEGTRVKAFVQEGNTARERTLTIGGKYGEFVEVTEGVSVGEKLIVVGQNNLTNGVKINVVK